MLHFCSQSGIFVKRRMTSESQHPRVVPDILRKQARLLGEQPALVVDRGAGPQVSRTDLSPALTFCVWDRRSDTLAAALIKRGLRRGDRVALAFENRDADRFFVGYFAVAKAGGVAVPVGVRLAEAEVGQILRHAEPRFACAGDTQARSIASLGLSGLSVLGPADFDRTVAEEVAAPAVDVQPDDLCDILYTSGTTGTPKGVSSTHANLVSIRSAGLKPFAGQAFLHAVPVHTFAGTHAMQYLPLRAGMVSVVMHRFEAARYLALVAAHRVAVAYAVPAMLRLTIDRWEATGPAERPDTSSLMLLMFGASAMPASTFARLPELFPSAMLVNLYASTESGSASCAMPPGEAQNHPGAVGVPVPPTEIRIVIDEGGRDVTPGEIGEIWIKGSVRGRSYYKDPEATARTFVDGGWVRTGDLGHLDKDGYLYLDGRQKEMVNRGGLKIFVDELDSVLMSHPAVQEAALVGIPHPVLGEDLAGFVVLRAGASASAEELRAYLLERVAEYKVPRRWSFIGALPRNSMGKVVRRQLAAQTTSDSKGGPT